MRRCRERGLATSVHIDLTLRCNFGCIHCLHGTTDDKGGVRDGEMTTADVVRLLNQLADSKVMSVSFSGGEVFLHPGLEEILRTARSLWFHVQLKSNGSMITPDRARMAAALGVRRIDVSLYSIDPVVHDAITRRPGSHGAVMAGLEAIRDAGMITRAVVPLMRANMATAVETVRACRELGYSVLVGYHIHGECDAGDERWGMNVSTRESLEVMAQLADASTSVRGMMPRPLDSAGCKAGIWSLYVSSSGDVFPCVVTQVKLGNVLHQSFKEILDGPARRQFLEKTRRDWVGCQACLLLPYCVHCMGEAQRLTGDPWRRHPFVCKMNATVARFAGGHRVGREYVFEPGPGTPGEER